MIEYNIDDVQKELKSVRAKLDGILKREEMAKEHTDFVNWALHRETLKYLKSREKQLYEYEYALLDIIVHDKA